MHFNDIINAVLNGLAEFRFQDFIDIVIITVIIYKIICWTVNTRAYQLLKGLAVLLVVMLLSALFNLYTVNYLLNTLLVSGIVVMVVLFQPELRRLLGLRSTDIEFSPQEDGVTVTTHGFGHRVGLSQYGAEAMAQAGRRFDEILLHYYQGTEIRRLTLDGEK